MPAKLKPVTNQPTTVPVLFLPHVFGPEQFAPFSFSLEMMVYPGANQIPVEIWEKMQAHPLILHKIEAGALREADLTLESDRVHWVRGCWLLPELRAMAQTETSATVQEEIDLQIKRLINARFPSVWKNSAGENKGDYLCQCGPRIWREAYSLPSQMELQHQIFWHPQNRPVPA